MSLPFELQRLLPQALDVLRYLGTGEGGATTEQIMHGTGLSERTSGKAIRNLVTRYYLEMPEQGYYLLTETGWQAVQDLRAYDGDTPYTPAAPAETPEASAASPAEPASAPRHTRRLSIFLPREFVISSTAILRAGFDSPADNQVPLTQPGRVILRLNATYCDVDPSERPLEVAGSDAAGPVRFRVTPFREGEVRLKLEAFQLVAGEELLVPVGGMYFDLNVAGFPTPLSAEFQTLGALVGLHPGDKA
jgi:predicted transcriptional regulator